MATDRRLSVVLQKSDGTALECDGITHHVAWDKGKVTVGIPSTCLHTPRQLRAGVGFGIVRNGDHEFVDDGFRTSGLAVDSKLALSSVLRLSHPVG